MPTTIDSPAGEQKKQKDHESLLTALSGLISRSDKIVDRLRAVVATIYEVPPATGSEPAGGPTPTSGFCNEMETMIQTVNTCLDQIDGLTSKLEDF